MATSSKDLVFAVSTWNVGASSGASVTSQAEGLDAWLRAATTTAADIHIVAFQEIININEAYSYVETAINPLNAPARAMGVLGGLDNGLFGGLFFDKKADGLDEPLSAEADMWEMEVCKRLATYKLVAKQQLVGMMVFVLVAQQHADECTSVRVTYKGTGPLGVGNKGGVAVSLGLYGSTVCIINSHLAAGSEGACSGSAAAPAVACTGHPTVCTAAPPRQAPPRATKCSTLS
jgi:hypothetical protein